VTETLLKGNYCPVCHRDLSLTVDPVGDKLPNPGDLSICIYCTSVLLFDADMKLGICPQEILDECEGMIQKVLAARPKYMPK